jgi:hypothetical protein
MCGFCAVVWATKVALVEKSAAWLEVYGTLWVVRGSRAQGAEW